MKIHAVSFGFGLQWPRCDFCRVLLAKASHGPLRHRASTNSALKNHLAKLQLQRRVEDLVTIATNLPCHSLVVREDHGEEPYLSKMMEKVQKSGGKLGKKNKSVRCDPRRGVWASPLKQKEIHRNSFQSD